MKSHAKRQRNGWVRMIRAEMEINIWTRARGYVLTRDRDQAVKLLDVQIDRARKELAAAVAKRDERKADSNG